MDYRLPVLSYGDSSDAPNPAEETISRSSAKHSTGPSAAHGGASKPAQTKPTQAQSKKAQRSSRDTGGAGAQNDQARSNALQELRKERKRRAFIAMLKLLEHGASDAQQLHALVAPMSDEELLQVAEERALAGKCGNPLCTKAFRWQEPRKKFIATASNIHKIEGDSFCSKACGSFVQQLAAQLVNPMNRIKPSAFEEYMSRPSHKPQQGVAAQGGGVETMKTVIEERPPYQLIHEAEEAGKQLDAAAAASSGDSTAAAAVEGYVPSKTPSKQPKQQRPVAEAPQSVDDEPLEVLQLQPVLKRAVQRTSSKALPHQQQQQQQNNGGKPVKVQPVQNIAAAKLDGAADQASKPTAAAAADNSVAADKDHTSSSSSSIDSMLETFRQLQSKQVQHINEHHDDAVDIAVAGSPTAAAATEASTITTTSISSGNDGSTPAVSGQVVDPSTMVAAAQVPADAHPKQQQRERRVTFAPDVQYSCPADPQDLPEQPVLTFTMLDADGANAGSGGSSGLVGELQLTSADDLEPEAAADSEAAGGSSDSGGPLPLPEHWKLFLPPALGGVGVPVKQLVKTRPIAKQLGQQKEQERKQRHDSSSSSIVRQGIQAQHQDTQSSRSDASAAALAAGKGSSSNGSDAAVCGPAPGTTSHKVHMALNKGVAMSSKLHSLQQAGSNTANAASKPDARSNTGSTTAASSSQEAGAASAAGTRTRKFAPVVRPRRSVVVLDESELPGVTIRQRGVRPSSNGHLQLQSQQQQMSDNAASVAHQGDRQVQQLQDDRMSSKDTTVDAKAAATNVPTAVHTAANSKPADEAHCSSDDGSDSEGENYDPGSEASEQEQWYHERDLGQGSSSKRETRNGNQQRQQHQGSRAGGSSSSEDEDDDSEVVGDDGLGLNSDDDAWCSDSEGLETEGLGLGVDAFTNGVQSALQSVLPFLDTKGVTVHLSEFGLLWNTLHAWISPATVAYVNSRQQQSLGSVPAEAGFDQAVAGGASSTVTVATGSTEGTAHQQGVPSLATIQQRAAMATMFSHALPVVIESLGISISQSELNKHLNALTRGFYMQGPLPALQAHQWQLIVGLLLAALSAWRLPVMRPLFAQQQQPGSKLDVMLRGLGSDVDRFMALLDLFELDR